MSLLNFRLEETDLPDYQQTDMYTQLNLLLYGQETDPKEQDRNPNGKQTILEQTLEITEKPQTIDFCIKKLGKLTPGPNEIRNCCYIPEQNLLFLILRDAKTVRAFDTIRFRPIYTKTFEKPIYVVKYSTDCKRVFFGGEDFYVEVYNPQTWKSEQVISNLIQGDHINEIIYIKTKDAIAVGTSNRNVYILSRDLNVLAMFRISVFRDEPIIELMDLENGFLLVKRRFFNKKRFSLCNLSNKKVSDFPDIEVSLSSSIDVLKDGPRNIITFLASIPENPERFRLVQIIQEGDTENLVVSKVGPQSKEFLSFKKIENSKYFTAKFREGASLKIAIMAVYPDKVEIVQTIVGTDFKIGETNHIGLIKDNFSLLIGSDNSQNICIYNIRQKMKKE